MKKIWMTVPLALSLSLVACGGGGSTPAPAPAPTPTPPVPTPGAISSIGGVVRSPGTIGSARSGGTAPLSIPASGASWWTEPDSVQRRQAAAGASPEGIIPGEYIVRLKTSLGTQELSSIQGLSNTGTLRIGDIRLQLVRSLGLPGMGLYRTQQGEQASAALSARQVASRLSARSDVLSAEPNRWMHVMSTPNDKFFPLQWGAQAMKLPAAWDITTGLSGTGVTVAVVDTGIVNHPDLTGRLLPGIDFVQDPANSGDGDGADTDPTDEGGDTGYHGTHVTGIIAAATNNGLGVAGVSWGARIVPVRVLGVNGGGSLADILLGVYWAAGGEITGAPKNAHPAQVINLSLGGTGECSEVEQQVFDDVFSRGVTAVVAAGNENSDASTASPANCKNVITVGALGPDGKRAYYSNYGGRIDVMAPGGNTKLLLKVGDQQFPGGILSTFKDDSDKSYGYTFYQGTSQAAPQVAGVAALLLSAQPTLTPAQVLAHIKAAAVPVSDASCGVKAGCGAGLIDAPAALRGAGTPSPAPTPTPTPTPAPVPQPVSEIKTLVAAFYRLPQGFDLDRSPAALLDQKTLRNPYRLENALPGSYIVGAWQDTNGNGKVDNGEPLGAYPDYVTVDNVSRSIVGIDIVLEPFKAASLDAAARADGPEAAPAQNITPAQSLGNALLKIDRAR